MSVGWLVHAANITILASFLVRDIIWLRALSILAGGFFIPYFLFQPTPMIEPVVWNSVFMAINLVQIYRLFMERRPVHLNAEQARLRALAFPGMSPRQLLALLKLSAWREVAPEQHICVEGEAGEDLMILVTGRMRVEACGEVVGDIEPGDFVGELSYITGDCSAATVTAREPCRVVSWGCDPLRSFLKEHPELRASVQAVLSRGLARRLASRA